MNDSNFALFNSNDGNLKIAIGSIEQLISSEDSLSKMDLFIEKHSNKFIITAFAYDLKNEIENLESNNIDSTEFPNLIAWTPEFFIEVKESKIEYLQGNKNSKTDEFIQSILKKLKQEKVKIPLLKFIPRISKNDYIKNINRVKNEIQLGNTYELNFCQEFYAENCPEFDSLDFYTELNAISEAPFSAYYKCGNIELFCASPERFIQRKGNKIISQPIKGTIKRGENIEEDKILKSKLYNSSKERSENVMIVDLVRNDLSKIAEKASVNVDSLFGIFTFKTVHHMISTISCKLKNDKKLSDIVKATFPMGSMTGAPKIKTMKLIEEFEDFKRGIYSGSIGYIKPNGDFDFNVVIRTFVKKENYISCAVGGAITINSDANSEYEECLTKVKKLIQLFGDQDF